jgi:hypothetical protein
MTQRFARLRIRTDRLGPVLAMLVGIALAAGPAQAANPETREFQVLVDGKACGSAKMTFDVRDNGTIQVSSETDVLVKILFISYKYSYRGVEVWKDGRLQRFDSNCTDDGKKYQVQAAAEDTNLRVQVNDRVRVVDGDIWLTSYWKQPDNKKINQNIPLIDSDTGKDLNAQVLYVGAERRAVAGEMQDVQHFRLKGKANVDLWYDVTGRIVRQEWMEQGHRTTLDLLKLRR